VLDLPEVWDTLRMPLFTRLRVRPICSEAVRGDFFVPDTVTWKGIKGLAIISAKAVASGQASRDKFMQGLILESGSYPDIRFILDSVTGVTRTPGDTVKGKAIGKLVLRGIERPMTGTFLVRRDIPSGGLRVLSKFKFPAGDLTEHFNMSKWALGLGVSSGIWRDVWEGVDLVLRPSTGTQSSAAP